MIKFSGSEARFFGLRVWPKRRSDAEYVEFIRKGLRAARWLRYLSAVIGIGVIILVICAIQLFLEVLNNGAVPPGQQNLVNIVFGTAIVLGITIGFSIGSMAHRVAISFFGQRQEQLLVDCWDAIDRLIAEGDTSESQSLSITDNSRQEMNVGSQ